MNEIILATFNNNKAKEFSSIFGNKIKLITLSDIGFTGNIIEDGKTFIDNSLIKSKEVYSIYAKPVMADDSGLCISSLNGAPGVLSARFGSAGLTDKERYEYLLTQLDKKKVHEAAFVCALVLFINPNRIYIIQEETKGEITFNPNGQNGFGYDPIFYLPQFGKTMAELTDGQKNEISHRGKASKLMKEILNKYEI